MQFYLQLKDNHYLMIKALVHYLTKTKMITPNHPELKSRKRAFKNCCVKYWTTMNILELSSKL